MKSNNFKRNIVLGSIYISLFLGVIYSNSTYFHTALIISCISVYVEYSFEKHKESNKKYFIESHYMVDSPTFDEFAKLYPAKPMLINTQKCHYIQGKTIQQGNSTIHIIVFNPVIGEK